MDDVMFPEDDHSVYYMILFLFVGHVMAPDFYDTYFNMGAGGTVSIAMQSGVALYQHITHWLTWHTIHRPIEWRWNSASTRHLGITWREEIQWAHSLAYFMTKVHQLLILTSFINFWWAIALPVRTMGHQLIGVVVSIIATKMLWELHKIQGRARRSFREHSRLWAECRKDGAVWCNLTWWAHQATTRSSLFTLFVWAFSVINMAFILVKGVQGLYYPAPVVHVSAVDPSVSVGSV
ncbi:hypothetical protein QBC42DRAFT_311130 [Cladorrhinum samala]|uniref:Uncharacterized protein n=1 Tax=Cladorrhinum samala TaxID=585594 RepID=A0AAV9HJX5_9PEZI|nr:hypothetical protein QBC42DRAFT_311130 [Cladorrhinum samala]